MRNTPTLRYVLTLTVLTFTSLSAAHSGAAQRQRDPLENSNDLAMLERIASADGSADVENVSMGQGGKFPSGKRIDPTAKAPIEIRWPKGGAGKKRHRKSQR